MKPMQLIVLGVAVAATAGAGYMALQLSNREPVVQASAPIVKKAETAEILVAKVPIKMGNRVNADMLKWQEWPKSALADGYITKKKKPDAIETLVGSVARAVIYKQEPIRETKLVNAESGFMSAILPKGQRAVATGISRTTSAGGFILPNDRVDVLVTRRKEGDKNKTYTTDVILENIRVLAIDQVIEEKDGKASVIGETATLQLNPSQVEELAIAQETAERISLTLRSIADSGDDAVISNVAKGPKRGSVRLIRYGTVETLDATISDRVSE